MTRIRFDQERAPDGVDAPSPAQELPDWLAAIRPTGSEAEPAAAPPAGAAPVDPVAASPVKAGPVAAPAQPTVRPAGVATSPIAPPRRAPAAAPVAAPEPAPTASLLAAEDLPAWLRKLGETPTSETAAPPLPPAPAGTTALPTWLEAAPSTAADAAPAPAVENAPPVWAPRENRPAPEATTGAAIFASLTEASVSGSPIDASSAATGRGSGRMIPWWWYVAAAIVLALAVAAALSMVMR
jgi:hypothetical protein